MGFMISKHGVHPNLSKTVKVNDISQPTNLTSLRSFIGFASYYRRFVLHFATAAAPVHSLTKKDTSFEWDGACEIVS